MSIISIEHRLGGISPGLFVDRQLFDAQGKLLSAVVTMRRAGGETTLATMRGPRQHWGPNAKLFSHAPTDLVQLIRVAKLGEILIPLWQDNGAEPELRPALNELELVLSELRLMP